MHVIGCQVQARALTAKLTAPLRTARPTVISAELGFCRLTPRF